MKNRNDPQKTSREILIRDLLSKTGYPLSCRSVLRMSMSIESIGLIEPIVVFKDKTGYRILDGHTRYMAMKALGHETIPCNVLDMSDLNNQQRE